MRLRTDFKYALIDEYYTYWDAFDNLPEFYSKLHSVDESVFRYTMSKTEKINGTVGVVQRSLYSQNEMWIVYYSDNKKVLEVIDNASSSEMIEPLAQKKFGVRSTIVETAQFQLT
tara:strand:+ start:57 stop:401 length:345 start_codon:yes stop_codon:yes gene_type:complete